MGIRKTEFVNFQDNEFNALVSVVNNLIYHKEHSVGIMGVVQKVSMTDLRLVKILDKGCEIGFLIPFDGRGVLDCLSGIPTNPIYRWEIKPDKSIRMGVVKGYRLPDTWLNRDMPVTLRMSCSDIIDISCCSSCHWDEYEEGREETCPVITWGRIELNTCCGGGNLNLNNWLPSIAKQKRFESMPLNKLPQEILDKYIYNNKRTTDQLIVDYESQ